MYHFLGGRPRTGQSELRDRPSTRERDRRILIAGEWRHKRQRAPVAGEREDFRHLDADPVIRVHGVPREARRMPWRDLDEVSSRLIAQARTHQRFAQLIDGRVGEHRRRERDGQLHLVRLFFLQRRLNVRELRRPAQPREALDRDGSARDGFRCQLFLEQIDARRARDPREGVERVDGRFGLLLRVDDLGQRLDRRFIAHRAERVHRVSPDARVLVVQRSQQGVAYRGIDGGLHGLMSRSLPIEKALNDVMVVYGQNGEPLRPEQGYPIRLLVPGWEGNVNVKWLRRVKVLDQPAMTRDETSKYTDLMPDGTARQFTFRMEAKSLITRPSGGDTLPGAGLYELTGLAWSGQGAIAHVDVTLDGGGTWTRAELQTPVLPVAHTRFRLSWRWDGREAIIASRCTDETGYVQPTLAELVAVRGVHSNYHNNSIQLWKVGADGKVTNANRA